MDAYQLADRLERAVADADAEFAAAVERGSSDTADLVRGAWLAGAVKEIARQLRAGAGPQRINAPLARWRREAAAEPGAGASEIRCALCCSAPCECPPQDTAEYRRMVALRKSEPCDA